MMNTSIRMSQRSQTKPNFMYLLSFSSQFPLNIIEIESAMSLCLFFFFVKGFLSANLRVKVNKYRNKVNYSFNCSLTN